ncbi:MAG: DUF3368 domain-containing protein [Desulfobacteraceae bacterium]|nr:DUF3368 domain-containing protein [Desulfobacteraceae bacterium]
MYEQVIVADSSPLIGLAKIHLLGILPKLSSHILIPPAVWEEVTIKGDDSPDTLAIRQATWLMVQIPIAKTVEPFKILVDFGEAEAMALAIQSEGSLLLLDDSRARRIAKRLKIRVIGTVGLLRRAKQRGLIEQLRPRLEGLQNNGIYIRQELIDAVLKDVGE